MSLRLLLGILAPGPPDHQSDLQTSEIEIKPQDKDVYDIIKFEDIQNAAKFHIGMLSISLIIGLAYGGFTIWWMEKKPFLTYVLNLLIALVCRTFFSILFDGVVLLGSANVAGGNALLAFEQISINLVLAFWLSLTIYLHARVQRNFKSEPTLNLYRYGVPGVAVFFAFIWIVLLQTEFPSILWWVLLGPTTQWIVNSFNLLCVLIQLALVGDIARIMMKTSLDNDSVSLFRKTAILMGVLVFIFWLQFGLFMGRVPMRNAMSYTYFFYFVDGIQCACVCLVLYFFNNWVQMLLNSDSMLMGEESVSTTPSNQELLAGSRGRGVVTLDSVFMTNESGKLKKSEEEGDVVYSNVVDPQRWGKILDLYKRLNKDPDQQGTVVEGDAFYDCPLRPDRKTSKRTQRSISVESGKRISSEDKCVHKNDKMCQQIQKKNAFYSSKYLVLDSKLDVPKYLETRPSLSSKSGRSTPKEGRMSKDSSPDITPAQTEELVEKWLSENSKNMPKKDSPTQKTEEEPFFPDKKPSDLDVSKHEPVETGMIDQDTAQHTEERVSVTKKIISTIDSVLRFSFSGNDERKNSTAEYESSPKQEATGQHLIPNASPETSETIKSEAESEKKPTESLHQSSNSSLDKTPRLATKEDESDKPGEVEEPQDPQLQELGSKSGEVPVSEPQELRSKPETPPPEKNENFGEERPVSNAEIEERKDHEPNQSDAEVSEAKVSYLNQYLTNSELQECRMNREKQASDQRGQAPKSIFSFPEAISSMVGYFVSGGGSLLGLRADPKLSNTENLTPVTVSGSECEAPAERESGKTEMKDIIQYEEQTSKLTTVPSKPISEVECVPMRKISISSGSEFSIERINMEEPRHELWISKSEKFPKSTENPRLSATEETHTSTRSSESSDSFSLEQYYQGLHNAKQTREQRNQRRT